MVEENCEMGKLVAVGFRKSSLQQNLQTDALMQNECHRQAEAEVNPQIFTAM